MMTEKQIQKEISKHDLPSPFDAWQEMKTEMTIKKSSNEILHGYWALLNSGQLDRKNKGDENGMQTKKETQA